MAQRVADVLVEEVSAVVDVGAVAVHVDRVVGAELDEGRVRAAAAEQRVDLRGVRRQRAAS